MLAQDGVAYRCRVQLQPHLNTSSPKAAVRVVSEWLQVVDVDLEDDHRVLGFTTEAPVSLTQLRLRLYNVGYGSGGSSCFNTVSGEVVTEGLPPFPVFEDTGDELADHARYDSAKEAWITNHPEAYQRMIAPTPAAHVHR